MQEKIIETKICRYCKSNFDITDLDMDFYDKISPIFSWVKYEIPSPTLCPDCRQQRRLSFRNENKVYKNKCKLCNKDMISMFSSDKSNCVYCKDCWYSDKWNALNYGIDFNFNKSFFEQFNWILKSIPVFAVSVEDMENSDYSNNASYLKNCYLCFNWWQGENCFYCIGFENNSNCVDCLHTSKSENCYECTNCVWCHSIFHSQDCTDCANSYFLKNCIWCNDCIWSVNLLNKKYHINNTEFSKEEYFKLKDVTLDKLHIEGISLSKNTIYKCSNIINSDNSEWNNIFNSNNVRSSFDILEWEDVKYSTELRNGSNKVMDIHLFWWNLELSYESCIVWTNASRILFSCECYNNVSDILYSYSCISNNKNLFWCIWLRNSQ
ncbi:MAG: hypothetical protein ACD_4C00236G0003, partial [uncultured bacterium (gcode 4)]